MSISDYNRVPITDAFSSGQAIDLGGAGTGFESFDRHMAAVGVDVSKAPSVQVSAELEGPQDHGLSGLVQTVQSKPLAPGR